MRSNDLQTSIGLLANDATVAFEDLKAWRMNL